MESIYLIHLLNICVNLPVTSKFCAQIERYASLFNLCIIQYFYAYTDNQDKSISNQLKAH